MAHIYIPNMNNRFPLYLSFSYAAAFTCAIAAVPTLAIETEGDIGTPATHEVVWQTEADQQYQLQASADMKKWTATAEEPVVGAGGMQREPITLSEETRTYYRTKVLGEQQFNLPLPTDGTRYDDYEEFDGPRWPANYGEGHVTLWHDGKFSAYSVTIDDNNTPDIPFWLQVSEDYGWKLTWFVIVHPFVWDIYNDVPGTNNSYFGSLAEWKAVHEAGQDVQLHGSCSAMNSLTAEAYEDHIVRSINVMEEATGTKILSYAYPCGKVSNGAHDYHEIISRYMIGARGTLGGITPVHLVDYIQTRSIGSNSLDNGEPSGHILRYNDKRAFLYSAYRGWGVSLYHGVGNSNVPGDVEAAQARVRATLDWVKANEDEFWVDSFTDVAKYAQERESSTLEIRSATADRIELSVTDRMDDKIYDHALTVKIRADNTWGSITAEQNGEPIGAYLVIHEGNTYAYVQPVPDQGVAIVTRGD